MKHKMPVIIASVAAIFSLAGGVYFYQIDRTLLNSTFTDSIQSQVVKTPATEQLSEEEQEKLQTRIDAIKQEIKKEQNDPDRAIELRLELLQLEQQLQGQN